MTVLLREIQSLRPEEMGDRLCSPRWPSGILVSCWCRSPVPHQDSPSGRATEEMLCEPSVLLLGACNARGAFSDVNNASAASMHDTLVGLTSPL